MLQRFIRPVAQHFVQKPVLAVALFAAVQQPPSFPDGA